MWWRRIFQVREKTFRALTGMSRLEFDRLVDTFHLAYTQAREAERQTARRRRPGGGRTGTLPSVRDKLLFILLYVKLYPIQELQGLLFGMSQPEAHFWIHTLLPVLEQALGHAAALPARSAATMEELAWQCPDFFFLLDGTERPIRRPQDGERQKTHYSGKKKRHMVKNTIITNTTGRRVVYVGETRAGSVHDKRAAEEDAPPFPADSHGGGDSGYQGYTPAHLTLTTPQKKPKGGELTAEEKEGNRRLAQIRVYVEHAIGGIKVHRIVADPLRNTTEGFADQAIGVAAGLYNYKSALRDAAKRLVA
jgi:hypothetical protein